MRAARSGLIINTSSIAGRVSVPVFGTDCATNHALEAYGQILRYEVSPLRHRRGFGCARTLPIQPARCRKATGPQGYPVVLRATSVTRLPP